PMPPALRLTKPWEMAMPQQLTVRLSPDMKSWSPDLRRLLELSGLSGLASYDKAVAVLPTSY
ncbi:MAG: hypothetical protein LN409_04075, partial [Candidatus Thermoplasmatota archaeon]|nr:hypothetical protein [Candidatus Thermoplasmatota archaeon]